MKNLTYFILKSNVLKMGYMNEVKSIQNILECPRIDSIIFLFEYIWVVVNSGMKNQVAEKIFFRIIRAIYRSEPLENVFGHLQKVKAIEYVLENKEEIFLNFLKAEDKLSFLESLPFIGGITKYHLARNLGIDVCKPDRHLKRVAENYNTNPFELCKSLSSSTGDKVGVIDLVIWRAANLGFI